MPFSSLFPQTIGIEALTELQRKFGEARSSLVRIRADRVRLARTGWRPRVPSETKLIRSAEWTVEAAVSGPGEKETRVEFDLESRFVPTENAFSGFATALERVRADGRTSRVFIRGLELDEPRFTLSGRAVPAAFFDLVLALSRDPGAVVVLPKVDGYLEARFWAEVARSLETAFALARESIRFEVAIDTLGGVVEAEEILFELKDSVIGIVYDVRLDRFDALRLESGAPSLEAGAGLDVAARAETLLVLARKRGVRFDLRARDEATGGVVTLDSLHERASFAFRFLCDWFGGNPSPLGSDWTDFELARALLWTAIHSGFLREENYEAWREEFGHAPFEAGTTEDAAIRTLDPLVRTAVFPDSAKPLAFSVLLEREKMRSVSDRRLA
jgi:hypothetical protein